MLAREGDIIDNLISAGETVRIIQRVEKAAPHRRRRKTNKQLLTAVQATANLKSTKEKGEVKEKECLRWASAAGALADLVVNTDPDEREWYRFAKLAELKNE